MSAKTKISVHHVLAASLLGLLLAGCAAPKTKLSDPPIAEIPIVYSTPISSGGAPVAKLGDRYWVMTSPFIYRIFNTQYKITIPKGFVTDLASVPRSLWSFGLAPHDSYMSAAIIHDYLYWDQRCSKAEADSVLKLAMYESKVGGLQRWLVYRGVASLGRGSFDDNARRKVNGERRLLTPAYTDRIIATDMTTETTLVSVLRNAGQADTVASDAGNTDIKEFCRVAASEIAKL